MSTNDNDVAKLKSEIETLRKDFAEVTETLKQLSGEQAHASIERVREQAEKTSRQLEGEIRERPFTSVATAFGIGYLLAKLLDR